MSLWRRAATLGGLAAALVGGSAIAALPSADAQASSPCYAGKPDGWEVITEAISKPGENPLCNYRVTRKVEAKGADGKTSTLEFVSGTAITIEYYCSSDQGVEAFHNKTGPRTTETLRSANKVRIEEGPGAKNPDNPQSNGVTSRLFSGDFALFEKEWWLINDQTIATIVVLTNERGVVDESRRFGVATAEPQARTVAFQGAPDKEGCKVPKTGGGAAGGGGGGGKGGVDIKTIGGVTAVVIGGVLVWHRRRGRPPKRPPTVATAGTPPNCLKDAQAYEKARDDVLTLREAEQDLTEQLRRAETIHANNVMKAWMAASIDLGMAAGSVGSEINGWARRKPPSFSRGQLDTWHPPSSITARLSAMLQQAEAAIEAARARVQAITRQIGQIGEVLENSKRVFMQTARENLDVLSQRLRNLESRLPAAQEARSAYETAYDAWQKIYPEKLQAKSSAGVAMSYAEQSLKSAEQALGEAGRQAEARLGYADAFSKLKSEQGELAEIQREVDNLGRRTDPAGRELLTEQQRRLARYEDMVRADKDELARIAQEVNDAVQHEVDRVTNLRSDVADLTKKYNEAARVYDNEVSNVDRLREQARSFNDVTTQSVAAARNDVSAAQVAVDTASQHGDPLIAAQLDAKKAELLGAENDLSFAEAYRDGLRNQADFDGAATTVRGASGAESGSAANAIANVVKHPLRALGEIVFGVGQSPEEIKLILRQGQENVNLIGAKLRAVERATEERKSDAERLRGTFDRCVAAHQPAKQDAVKEPAPASS